MRQCLCLKPQNSKTNIKVPNENNRDGIEVHHCHRLSFWYEVLLAKWLHHLPAPNRQQRR